VVEEREMPMELHDEQLKRIDERFDDVDRRLSEGKKGTDRRLSELKGDIREVKGEIHEVKGEIGEVKGEVGALGKGMETLHGGIHQATLALWIGSAGIAAAILVKG
jgi:predicted  nucleic acid-binding Zn-ribbon protein